MTIRELPMTIRWPHMAFCGLPTTARALPVTIRESPMVRRETGTFPRGKRTQVPAVSPWAGFGVLDCGGQER
jgi:hypothetical protein